MFPGALGEHRAEARDVGRIVLPIAVQGRDPFAAGRADAVAQRRALPEVVRVAQDPEPRLAAGPHRLESGEGIVVAAIIDHDDFVLATALEALRDLLDQGDDVLGLVIDGDHER